MLRSRADSTRPHVPTGAFVVVAIVALSGVLSGCRSGHSGRNATAVDSAGTRAARPIPDVASVLRQNFVLDGVDSRTEIRDRLGEADSVTYRTIRNRHDPTQLDTLVGLYYPGLHVEIYAVTGGGDLLSRATVSENRYLGTTPVRLGEPWDEVLRRIGPPADSVDGGFRYDCRSCEAADEAVHLLVDLGVLEAVRFSFYVD